MKRSLLSKRILSVVLTFFLLCLTIAPAKASTMRASDYIDRCFAIIEPGSNGNLSISFSIFALGRMDRLGATAVYLYEDSGAGFQLAGRYYSYEPQYSYFLTEDTIGHSAFLPYQGTPGNRYYAIVYFIAENESGSDTSIYTTPAVTARQ